MSKEQAGTLTFVKSVGFSHPGGKLKYAFNGTANLYAFSPEDKKSKVTYVALIKGVPIHVMCGASGDVGEAILRSAGLCTDAKNAPLSAEYFTFPDPIGCPAKRLEDRDDEQALVFYKK